MALLLSRKMYNCRQRQVMRSGEEDLVRNDEDRNGQVTRCICITFMLFSNRTATALENAELVVYQAHMALLNCSTRFRWRLIENWHTVVVLLLVTGEG